MKCNHSPDTFHPGTTLYLDGDTYTIYLLWPCTHDNGCGIGCKVTWCGNTCTGRRV